MAFPRDVLDRVGLLDDMFWPGYFEDVDYCFRVRDAGYEVRYVPESCLIHDESTALGGSPDLPVAFHRGRLRFALKHLPPQRYLSEYVPAERAFLLSVAREEMGKSLRRLYVEMLPGAAVILARRWKSDRSTVSMVLWALLGLYQETAPGPLAVVPNLGEFEFASPVPIVGPVLARLRSLWYSVAARWAVRHLAQQQVAINCEYQRKIKEQEAINTYAVRSLLVLSQELAELVREVESGQEHDG